MKEELPNEKLREAEDMEIDIKELLFKCLIHWPMFICMLRLLYITFRLRF